MNEGIFINPETGDGCACPESYRKTTISIKEDDLDAIFEAAQLTLAEALDRGLYQPVKKEIASVCLGEIQHSLGQKKEKFKGTVEEVFEEMKNAITLKGV